VTAAPAQPAQTLQEPAGAPRPAFGPLRVIRAAAALQASAKAKHVLLAMAAYADFQTGRCWVSTATLSADTGLSYNTVAAALDELQHAGTLILEAAAKGRRAPTYTLVIESRTSVDPQQVGPKGQGRPPAVGTQELDETPKGWDPKLVGSQIERRRVPTVGTNQTEQRKAAAVAGAHASPAAPRPETLATAAAAEPRQGGQNPAGTAPISEAALPPLSPTNAPQGHVAGLAGTPWGMRLIEMLKTAGALPREVWAFARRVDFDYDLVAYIVHRARECRPRAADGTTESPTAHASRRAGLLKILAREPREGLVGFQGLTQQRHANRAAAVANVWAWLKTNPPTPEQNALVAAWGERHDLMNAGPKEWARHLPVIDLDLYPARTGAAGCAKAWDAILAGIKEQTRD